MRTTHTYAVLELSASAYDEIARKLRDAGYDHAFDDSGVIDMHGIAIAEKSTHTNAHNGEIIRAAIAKAKRD